MLLRVTLEAVFGLRMHIHGCAHITTNAKFNQNQPLTTVHQATARATAPGQCASVPGCSGGGGQTLVCYMNFLFNFTM